MHIVPLALSFAVSVAVALPVAAAGFDTVVPVVSQAPLCKHHKLGQVRIQYGTRVSEATRDLLVPTVDYRRAFAALAAAAEAKGGDAVIVRWHQAMYFTRNGRRSQKPVHVQLRGAVIRTQADAAPCSYAIADPVLFAERASSGKPVDVSSGDAYSE